MVYSVAKVKLFRGRNGYGLNADLMLDGKPIAEILDDAGGGAMRFYFKDRADEPAFKAFAAKWFAESRPGENAFEVDAAWVNAMVDAIEADKRLARLAKASLMFRLKGDAPGSWRAVKIGGKPAPAAAVRAKYGELVEMIYGEAA